MSGTIRDRVGVRVHPTVVRLEEQLDADWITEAYHLTADVRAHVAMLDRALAQPAGTGAFLIGAYGSGKSHFLAWWTRRVRADVHVVVRSLLNYRADTRLEDVVTEALGITNEGGDRREGFAEAQRRHPEGLVLVLDELSEFLRSKPDARSFNEDLRYLQFLGEWAQGARFFVLAAMQEAIEHTGDLEHGVYLKIKDRYPLRLLLTTQHVRDLVADHVLVKRADYDDAVKALAAKLKAALPGAPIDESDFTAVYPLHPATLALLEEVRDRFSQTRGVVEFVTRRLAGDATRGLPPFLDRPWGELVTPDEIVDHFADVLELQAEFQPLAQRLLPWARQHLDALFETDALRTLARRALNLLVLAHLSPRRDGITVAEASWWLLFAATRLDPEKNHAIVERVLTRLADRGRYVRRDGARYRLDLEDDGAARLEKLLERELADLPRPEVMFEALAAQGGGGFDPFALPRDRWQARSLMWSFHERPWSVWLGDGTPPPAQGIAVCVRLPWGASEPAAGCHTVHPARLEPTPALRELAALVRLRGRALGPEIASLVERRVEARAELFRVQVREAYAQATLTAPGGEVLRGAAVGPGDTLDKWLDATATLLFRRAFPSFERFAPRHGEVPVEGWRAFLRFATEHDLGAAEADDWTNLVREAYLVPMQLLSRQGRGYAVPQRLDRHELVRLVQPLLAHEPAPRVVYEHLAQPVYGLVPDQAHALIAFLLVVGEIDVLKGRRSMRAIFEELPTPLQYDRVVAGSALGADALRSLERLCEGLRVAVPSQWTVTTQRRAVRQLREAIELQTGRLRPLVARLEGTALGEQLDELLGWCAALQSPDGELAALERFLYEAGSPERFLARLHELSVAPARLDRQIAEVGRFRHLFGQAGLAEKAAALGDAPDLSAGDAVDAWLARARTVHAAYAEQYAAAHDRYWAALNAHPAWAWTPPPVARSRHLGLDDALRAFERARRDAVRCPGLSKLDFQSRCACGFDGEAAPAGDALAALAAARDRIEAEMALFFGRADVRERVRAWAEVEPGVRADADWPAVANLAAFDEVLAGVEVVARLDLPALAAHLAGKAWSPAEAVREFERWVTSRGATRVRFEVAPQREPDAVARWCLEQALRHGAPLPRGLGAQPHDVDPAWIGPEALANLESLGLDEPALERVLRAVIDGAVPLPERRSPLVEAAAEVVRPTHPEDAAALATLAERLYRAHPRLARLAGRRWLDRLDDLATTVLAEEPPDVTGVLAGHTDAGWLVVDALGLPLLGPFCAAVEDLLPRWRLADVSFARVGRRTTTSDFFGRLADGLAPHACEKVDAVDRLLHERSLELDDLARVALAELRPALAQVARRLDATRPVVVLADHGFRLDPEGRAWVHGGPSTLERVVPVLRLRPW